MYYLNENSGRNLGLMETIMSVRQNMPFARLMRMRASRGHDQETGETTELIPAFVPNRTEFTEVDEENDTQVQTDNMEQVDDAYTKEGTDGQTYFDDSFYDNRQAEFHDRYLANAQAMNDILETVTGSSWKDANTANNLRSNVQASEQKYLALDNELMEAYDASQNAYYDNWLKAMEGEIGDFNYGLSILASTENMVAGKTTPFFINSQVGSGFYQKSMIGVSPDIETVTAFDEDKVYTVNQETAYSFLV